MLSYRHGFHAGNFADVFKHVVLLALVAALQRKSKPFCFLDTHAGAGRYDLRDARALLNREYEHGIHRLWWRDDLPAPVARWREAVRDSDPALAEGAPPRLYPGSPLLVAGQLRGGDRLVLCELHPAEQQALSRLFADEPRAGVHARDGYEALVALLPPAERRGLVLVDPSYETTDEVRRIRSAVTGALKRFETGVYAIWYPLLARKSTHGLLEWARTAGARRVLRLELQVRAAETRLGMNGCGMLILNTPWKLDAELASTLPWLASAFGEGNAGHGTMEWLRPDVGG